MFMELIVKMNLPMTTADIITKTVKSAFPDSPIAQKYECGRICEMYGKKKIWNKNWKKKYCVGHSLYQRMGATTAGISSVLAKDDEYRPTAVQLQKLKSAYHQSLKSQWKSGQAISS